MTRNPELKLKFLLKRLDSAHARMERNKVRIPERGIWAYPELAVKNMLSVRRAIVAVRKELGKKKRP